MGKAKKLQEVPSETNSRIKKADEEIKSVLKKYNLTIEPKIDFPVYRELPIELQLAIKIIEKHDAVWKIVLKEATSRDEQSE